jgi:hypothetical protein
MTPAQYCHETLEEMERTIQKMAETLHRMEETRDHLKQAMRLNVPWGVAPDENLNEGPHYPGLG